MAEQDEHGSGGVRRFGRKDRKRRLDPRGPLIPPEPIDDSRFAPPVLDEPTPEPETAEVFPPAVIEPPAERFPPLAVQPDAQKVDTRSSAAPAPRRQNTCLLNVITGFFLLATVAAAVVFVLIAINPYSALNPFPPFTPVPILITTTPLPPTATEPPTPAPTGTFTPLPLEAIITPESPFPFIVANDGALYIPNANGEGCNWSSIAGSVTNVQSAPLDGYGIRIISETTDETVFSGSASTFGPGGFELFLNGVPQESTYTVQLYAPSGIPVSAEYTVSTIASCEQNVAILSFVQTREL
ncbi:MAG: hypothetical protein K8L97_05790 [Anaerolineae bacterium]|nr:hypothetical protein [Anaerolineae bacterium]